MLRSFSMHATRFAFFPMCANSVPNTIDNNFEENEGEIAKK